MEIFKTLTYYNDRNNTAWSDEKTWEEIPKVIEDESIGDANNVTADTFIHTPNTQRNNSNAIFKGEKLDKLDKLSDAVKDLTINNTKYYESNTANASDAQGDHTHNPETVTNTMNGNETVIHTNNRSFQKNYWVTVPSLSSSWRWTQVLTRGLRQLYWHHRRSWQLQQRKVLRMRRQAARRLTVLCGK